jgi:hypothetical protein
MTSQPWTPHASWRPPSCWCRWRRLLSARLCSAAQGCPGCWPPPAAPPQVSVSKEHITIVGDGSTQADVEARVKQIKNLVADVSLAAACACTHARAPVSPGRLRLGQERASLLRSVQPSGCTARVLTWLLRAMLPCCPLFPFLSHAPLPPLPCTLTRADRGRV